MQRARHSLQRWGRNLPVRLPLTCAWFVSLGAAELIYTWLPAAARLSLSAWASTNVHRLSQEPWGPLLVSGFVVEQHRGLWLVLAVASSAVVELRLGWLRTLTVLVSAHLTGTLVSEGVLWWRVEHGDLPRAALRVDDVGPSYLVVGLLVAVAVLGPVVPRLASVVVLAAMSPVLLRGLAELDVTALGHLVAAITGGAAAYWAGRHRSERPIRALGNGSTASSRNRLVR